VLGLLESQIKTQKPKMKFVNRAPTGARRRDAWKMLHSEDGPAFWWEDGPAYCILNNTIVPEWMIAPPESLDPQLFSGLTNSQRRAEFVRRVGLERIWGKLAKVIDAYGEYELGKIKIEDKWATYLKMHNPSVPEVWHIEGVGNECNTVAEALHWRKPDEMRKIPVSENGEDWFQQGDVCLWPEGASSLKPYPAILT
jgi:hypothetical protein